MPLGKRKEIVVCVFKNACAYNNVNACPIKCKNRILVTEEEEEN